MISVQSINITGFKSIVNLVFSNECLIIPMANVFTFVASVSMITYEFIKMLRVSSTIGLCYP